MSLQLRSFASISISLSIFAMLIMGTHTVDEQTVYPEMNLYRPLNNLTGNATYNCSIATPGGPILTWEVGGEQIITNEQFMDFTRRGIYIDPWPTNNTVIITTLVVSEQAWQRDEGPIPVQCVAIYRGRLNNPKKPPEPYFVIFYDRPNAIMMDKLQLVPMDKDLILQWDRPRNVPIEVAVDYTVIINSTDESMTIYNQYLTTNETSVSLQFLQDRLLNAGDDCIMFELSVSSSNDAGSAQLTTIMDSIPLSIDIRIVSDTLKVERVNLDPLLIEISFLPVMPCNMRYPLSNYSIKVDNVSACVIHIFDDNSIKKDGRVRLELNETTLPGVTLDGSFNLTVTACNNITCKESDITAFNTTDVQRAEAIFFKNRLFLRCSFAGSSQARGCAIILTLTGSTAMERFDLNIMSDDSASLCTEANNQREAYSSVEALDIEANGSDGVVRLDINSTVTVLMNEEEFVDMTGCRQPTNNTAAIVGGVIGGILGLLLIIAIVVVVVLGISYGWWCAWLEPEDMDVLNKGFGAATTPLLAFAGIGSGEASPQATTSNPLVQRDSDGRKPSLLSRKPKPFEQKLKDNKYLMVKTQRLRELIGDRNDAGQDKQPLMTTELKETKS